MAIGIETPGQFSELLGILKKRRWQILLPVCFGVAIAAAVAVFVPKKYEITTTVELRERNVAAEANSRSPKLPSTSREITNAENHIKHFKRIREVIESEDSWPEYELLDEADKVKFIEAIREGLTVTVLAKRKDEGSTFMRISYLASDPDRGQLFLTDLSKLWVKKVVERERTALREETKGLTNEVITAESDWLAASNEVLELVHKGSFSPTEMDPGKNSVADDPEFVRLGAQRDQSGSWKVDLAGLDAAVKKLQAELLETPEEVPMDLIAEGIDQSQKILEAETIIADLRLQQAKVTSRNQIYQQLQEKIEELEEGIALFKAQQRSAEVVQEMTPNKARALMLAKLDSLGVQREELAGKIASLEEAIASAEDRVTQRTELKEQLYVAIQKRDHLNENHALLSGALQAKRLQLDALENAYGDPYEFVQDPFAPDAPSQPEPFLIITIGLFVGLIVGVGSSLAAEFAKDGFRTAADLARSMNLPVLGVVDRIATRREKSARFMRRVVVGLSSAVLIAALLGFTYAYSQRPELLPVEWLERLDGLRAGLK
jgi:capsular polysaccharide biosynthesis protein